jgi:hypothetical protein
MRSTVAAALAALVVASPAAAGGSFADLAVGGSHVWFVGEPGVRKLDARTGRTLAMPPPTSAAYPISVTLAGGAAWVASVDNGYVDGTLSRIDERTGRAHVVWRRAAGSVQYVAAGAGGVWALVTVKRSTRIVLFDLSGRLRRVWSLPEAGRMSADASGCWVSATGRLLHLDRAGRVRTVLRAPLGDVATGGGAVWLPRTTSVLRVDERTGAVRTLVTGHLSPGGFQHDVAFGAGALWVLHQLDRYHSRVDRFDPGTGRRTGSAPLPGIADALVATPSAVWVATNTARVIRLDPRTLRRTLLVHVG